MNNLITFIELQNKAREFKSTKYFDTIKQYRKCFTGDMILDITKANKVIDKTVNNNSAHHKYFAFKWAFQTFYGNNFNPNQLHRRVGEISKWTTALSKSNVDMIKIKMNDWVNEITHEHNPANSFIKESRKKTQAMFTALLSSGARLNELQINWDTIPYRIMESVIDKKSYAGIVINTEKTGKKREIYIELEAFKILKEAKEMKMATFSQGLSTFKKWAKLDFDFTAHTLRRTFATAQANLGVPAPVIAMSLGNSVKVVLDHYVIDSDVNFEACDIANSFLNGSIKKTGNMYVDKSYLEKQ